MARYTPPEQSKSAQVVDIVFVVVAIFVALWLPLKLGLAGAAKAHRQDRQPDLGSARPERRPWRRSGKSSATRRETAHDIIQNRFHYIIDWPTLIIMAVVLDRLFRLRRFAPPTSEYREVIAERFDDKNE